MSSSAGTPANDVFFEADEAAIELDSVIAKSAPTAEVDRDAEAIAVALRKERILEAESHRVKSRVLFITEDMSVLERESGLRTQLVSLADVFDEIHIFILSGDHPQKEVERLAQKVWLYPVSPRFMTSTARTGVSAAMKHLQFVDGFRPDVVVALEPFAAATVAAAISKKFDRPWQLHIRTDAFLYPKQFLATNTKIRKRQLDVAEKMIAVAPSIKTATGGIQHRLREQFEPKGEVGVLPQFYHIEECLAVDRVSGTHRYEQFTFTALFVGDLHADSTLFRALDAMKPLMRAPTVGLVVIGTGTHVAQFRERAKLLGIYNQVLFLGAVSDLTAHLAAATVLLMTDTVSDSEEVVIQAAATGLPLVLATTDLRADLFIHEKSALLVEDDLPLTYSKAVTKIMNDNALRQRLGNAARKTVQARIEEDPRLYRIAFRDSIEDVLFAETEAKTAAEHESAIELAHQKALERSRQFTVVDGVEMRLPNR